MTSGSPEATLHPGAVIAGKYRVERVLGRGAMGAIALCFHDDLQQRVAVKVLLPESLADDWVRSRFVREARAAAKLESFHVARVSDVGTDPQVGPYIVMEYLEGCDLKQLLEGRGPLPVDEAVDYVLEAIDAVAEAHAKGIVHRDLKPANLFLAQRASGEAIVKVLDFGISKSTHAGGAAHSATSTQQILGSPSYMSPEQVKESKSVDGRADVWSLGVVLYELLTKEVPFAAPSLAELLSQILVQAPVDVRARRADLPEGLAAVIMRCLEKDPLARFTDVGTLASALEPFGTGRRRDCVARARALTDAGLLDPTLVPQTVPTSAPAMTLPHPGAAPALPPAPGAPSAGGPPAALGASSGAPGPWPGPQSTRSAWGGASSVPMHRGGSLAVAAVLVFLLGGMGAYLWRARAQSQLALAEAAPRAAAEAPAPSASPSAAPPAASSAAPPPTPSASSTPSASPPSAAPDAAAPATPSAPTRPKPRPANPDDLLDRRH